MKYILVFLFLALAHLATAQVIVTDRPDQTESSTSLPKGYFQLETGTVVEIAGGTRKWVMNSNLFRYGLIENLELRLVTEISRLKYELKDASTVGIEDMQVGLKYQFIKKKIEFAYLGHLYIPSGSEFLSAGKVGVSNKLLLSHDVTDNISFGYNFGHDYFNKDDQGLTYSYAIGIGLTDKIGFYLEVYGGYANFDTFNMAYDNGFTWLIKPNLQLDVSMGTGITEKSNYYSLGLSWRLPD